MGKRAKNPSPPSVDPYPCVVETFNDSLYEARRLADHFSKPYCFNGVVGVVRYRVTVERITEPAEVIHARLRTLWRESDNQHHVDPLRRTAEAHGMTLDIWEHGANRKARP